MKIGDTYGRLTVVGDPFKPDPTSYSYFVDCECSCGSGVKLYRKASLTKTKNNPTRSCGCLQREVASVLRNSLPLGQVFGRLILVKDLGVIKRRRMAEFNCSCGKNGFMCRYEQVSSGHTSSCGCLYDETRGRVVHGMHSSREYFSWQAMKERCRNPKAHGYENYGGRGVTYDTHWEEFENFFADMGERPDACDLDRIDVDGNYCKENCRWADRTIQTFNKRKLEGRTSKYFGVCYDKGKNLWHARLHYYKELVFNAYFKSEEDAAKAYDEACFKYYGVRKNFPDEKDNQ